MALTKRRRFKSRLHPDLAPSPKEFLFSTLHSAMGNAVYPNLVPSCHLCTQGTCSYSSKSQGPLPPPSGSPGSDRGLTGRPCRALTMNPDGHGSGCSGDCFKRFPANFRKIQKRLETHRINQSGNKTVSPRPMGTETTGQSALSSPDTNS